MPRTPQPGDFGVCGGTGLAMWVTRLGTFSRYGHAAIVETVNVGGTVTVIEAHPKGCRRRVTTAHEFVWSDYPLTDAQRAGVVAYAQQALELPYDWRAIGGFILRFWGAKIRGRSDDHADDRLVCSELVAWAWRSMGVPLLPLVAAGDVSPGDLAQWLDERRRG